jgi:hypothetical protein
MRAENALEIRQFLLVFPAHKKFGFFAFYAVVNHLLIGAAYFHARWFVPADHHVNGSSSHPFDASLLN